MYILVELFGHKPDRTRQDRVQRDPRERVGSILHHPPESHLERDDPGIPGRDGQEL